MYHKKAKLDITEIIRNNEILKNSEIIKILIIFSIPNILEQVAITMIQFIDTAMVGNLGAASTAAIGVTSSTIWLFNGIFAAICIGFTVQVSQNIGAGKIDEAKSIIRQGILFVIIFGILASIIGVIISPKLPLWLGAKSEVVYNASMYFKIIAIFFPFLFGVNLFSGIIRATGDMKTPMVLNILMGILDVIFNFYFIYPSFQFKLFESTINIKCMGYGVIGAAIGSGIAEVIVFILYLSILFFKNTKFKISFKESFRLTKVCIKNVLKLGFPVALERIVMCSSQVILTMIVASLGTVAIAANTISTTAESICYLPGFGISAAITVLLGQSVGAQNKYLTEKFAIIGNYIGMIIMGILGLLMFIFSIELISIFTNDLNVIQTGGNILKVEAFAEPFFAASIVIAGVFRGSGNSKLPFLIYLFSVWCVRIPICYFMSINFSIVGVWIGISFEIFIRGVISIVILFRKKWLNVVSIVEN